MKVIIGDNNLLDMGFVLEDLERPLEHESEYKSYINFDNKLLNVKLSDGEYRMTLHLRYIKGFKNLDERRKFREELTQLLKVNTVQNLNINDMDEGDIQRIRRGYVENLDLNIKEKYPKLTVTIVTQPYSLSKQILYAEVEILESNKEYMLLDYSGNINSKTALELEGYVKIGSTDGLPLPSGTNINLRFRVIETKTGIEKITAYSIYISEHVFNIYIYKNGIYDNLKDNEGVNLIQYTASRDEFLINGDLYLSTTDDKAYAITTEGKYKFIH